MEVISTEESGYLFIVKVKVKASLISKLFGGKDRIDEIIFNTQTGNFSQSGLISKGSFDLATHEYYKKYHTYGVVAGRISPIIKAVGDIAAMDTLISVPAKKALESENDMIEFVNYISDQCSEMGTNRERLQDVFGHENIREILAYSKRKAVEQDYFVMNKCIEADMKSLEEDKPKKHKLHILLTPEVQSKKPDSAEIIMEWGQLKVVFGGNLNDTQTGIHCFIEDTKENFIKWLGKFDGVVIGNGVPMMESFTVMHINEKLTPEETCN